MRELEGVMVLGINGVLDVVFSAGRVDNISSWHFGR